MTATVRRLMSIAEVRRTRLGVAASLGVLTIVFGVGLMGTSGYLISRAAEQPAVLSLTVAIVGVRFFGLARPIARYLERLASHDVALRSLGRARAQVYESIEPLAPAQLEDTRRGDLLSRFVADVDSLQNLYLRGLEPPLVALIAGAASVALAAVVLPAAGLALAVGLLVAGVAVPALSVSIARRSVAQQAGARGALTAELVETLAGSAEIAALGLERDRLRALRRVDGRLVRIARRAAVADGLGDALRLLVTGATVVGVLALSISAHADGRLDRTLIALLGLVSLAAFEAVQPLTESFRELGSTIAAGRRVLELTDRKPLIVDPGNPLPHAVLAVSGRARDRASALRAQGTARAGQLQPSPRCGRASRAARTKRRREDDGRPAPAALHRSRAGVRHPRRKRPALLPAGGRSPRDRRRRPGRASVLGHDPGEPQARETVGERRRALRSAAQGAAPRLGRAASPTASTRSWARRAESSPAASASASCWRAPCSPMRRVLVLDEPTAHLDHATAKRLVEDVFSAARDRAVLLITHRPEGVDLADEVIVLRG